MSTEHRVAEKFSCLRTLLNKRSLTFNKLATYRHRFAGLYYMLSNMHLLSLHNPVARAARALAGRYTGSVPPGCAQLAWGPLSHVETKIYGAFCLRQNAQRAALRAAGQATSGKGTPGFVVKTTGPGGKRREEPRTAQPGNAQREPQGYAGLTKPAYPCGSAARPGGTLHSEATDPILSRARRDMNK